MDASLKETEYDVLLVGTGMVEGILAGLVLTFFTFANEVAKKTDFVVLIGKSALARIGKKVLHLDQNDYYGSNYASFPLAQFLRWTKNEAIAPRNFGDEEENGENESMPNETATIDKETQRVLPMKSTFACRLLKEGFSDDATKEELLQKSSSFSIDVNPRLMLSSEQLVETLITSGVGRYLEFAAIERTYVHLQPSASGATTGQSKLLGMVEKRQLMKFLQFVADYGETHILHEDVKTKNERSLALGRALKRPQNKASQADGDAELAEYLDEPFQSLLEKHFKLSSKLQQVVVYCVGLASFPATKNQISAREGLAAVYRYVASIGRFTGTAFLAPLYGISELAQSFCRLSAVYGGIYVLRAPINGFVLNNETKELVGVRCSDGDVLRTKHVVTNGSYVDCLRLSNDIPTRAHGEVLRGVFVLKSSLRDGMSRLMLVIPPEDSEFQNHLPSRSFNSTSERTRVRRVFSGANFDAIAPDWLEQKEKQREMTQSVIKRLILSSEAERTKTQAKDAEDIAQVSETGAIEPQWSDRIAWRAIFTMDHLASGDSSDINAKDLPVNAWVCETVRGELEQNEVVSPLEIHLESASANARAIFEALCPGEPFLPKSASAEQAEQEEQESEEDAVLRAAQKLAQQTQLAEEQTQEGSSTAKATDSAEEANDKAPSSSETTDDH
ncbi:FAD/NAD(P)-binding domain [Phytophthora cactorum]|nr:FAD/NAD(P)-binding domain [Phytophthora cactorum]